MTCNPRRALWPAALIAALAVAPAFAADGSTARQAVSDAWWTGPILASGASTLPKGRALIEPYLYDAKPYGVIDDKGKRHDVPDADGFGSLTYLLYGVTDTFTAGVIPRFGYAKTGAGSSNGVQLGDFTLQGQYRLTQWKEGGRTPTISVMLQETLPTGRYDKLDDRPHDGFGSGGLRHHPGGQFPDLFLDAQRPHPAHPPERRLHRLGPCRRRGQERLRHPSRLYRPRQARRLVHRRPGLRIQHHPPVGGGDRPGLPARRPDHRFGCRRRGRRL
jgi:hypothetical protein